MTLNRKDLRPKSAAMQHRHFCAIAEALRDSKPFNKTDVGMRQWEHTVNSFIVVCRASNSRFDKERFIAACNYEVER